LWLSLDGFADGGYDFFDFIRHDCYSFDCDSQVGGLFGYPLGVRVQYFAD